VTPGAFGLAALAMFAVFTVPGDSTGAGTIAGQPAGAAEPTLHSLPAEMLEVIWQWVWYGDGKEQFDVGKPDQYSVQFFADGTVAIQADCNRGRGNFTLGPDQRITLGTLGTTMMLCPEGSLDDRFLGALDRVRSYHELEGDLLLEAPLDSGTLRFRRKATG